jgi:hypothetical protein
MRPAVPERPLTLDEVLDRWPTIRQSFASSYDDCNLGAWLRLKYDRGWSTTPQARGTIFHRTAAEILRTMQRQGAVTIPRREALEILVETCYQRDVPADEIVRVPLRQMPELRMAVDKFAKDNEFSIHKIVDIERKLTATLRYPARAGGHVDRELTGTLDVRLFAPPDEAVVLDYKDSWALPPEPKEMQPQGFDDEELKGLSFHGYFQQRWYGWLVLMNYRNIQKVTLREFYPRKTKVRAATLHRHQLPEVEQELGILLASLDEALMQGPPNLKAGPDGFVDIDALGWWKPQPGRHCGFCVRPTSCPIDEHVRVAAGGAAATLEEAEGWAARAQIATRIRTMAIDAMKGYVEMGGGPIPAKWSKGRLAWGWFTTKRGRRFGQYVPDQSERGGHHDFDQQLMDAMRESTARARRERGVKPRKTRRQRSKV